MSESHRSLSEILGSVLDSSRPAGTFGDLVKELDQHGMAMVLIVFSLPSALPIPAPGYSTILSIPLLLIGLRLVLGHDTVWLPERVQKREFNPASFQKVKPAMLKMVRTIERFIRPRLFTISSSTLVRALIGVIIIALGCSMLLPIPGTNTAPAFGIFLLGFGLLERDGLAIAVGMLASLVALAISLTIIFVGVEGIRLAVQYLKDLV